MHLRRDVGPFTGVNSSLSGTGRVEASYCGVGEVEMLGQ